MFVKTKKFDKKTTYMSICLEFVKHVIKTSNYSIDKKNPE